MGFIHGLAVVLIIFEGIIIQCKGTAPEDKTSVDWIQNAPIIEITGDQQFLPNDLIEVIISKSDFRTAQTSVRSRIVNATDTVMSTILRDRIILITPNEFDGNTREYYEDGDLFLALGSYQGLMSLFDRFGEQVKKIKIDYSATSEHRSQINRNIISRYASNYEELRITAWNDEGFWEEISNDNGIIFPKVKKLQFVGESSRKEFKLNLIFPKLESLKLVGSLADKDCLANITTLKELQLCTDSIREHKLEHIFASNKNMTMIALAMPERSQTMHAIAKHLTKLKTLQVEYPASTFLFRPYNRGFYKLSSVTHFNIIFQEINDLLGDLSFDMPNLKKLHMEGMLIDYRIFDFINYFKELETVELLVDGYNPTGCIEKLKNVKEFTANSFENQLHSLRKMFEHFDNESKLQTLKLLNFDDSYQRYKDTMKRINTRLAKSKGPTWTVSQGEQNGTGQKYLMFKRDL